MEPMVRDIDYSVNRKTSTCVVCDTQFEIYPLYRDGRWFFNEDECCKDCVDLDDDVTL